MKNEITSQDYLKKILNKEDITSEHWITYEDEDYVFEELDPKQYEDEDEYWYLFELKTNEVDEEINIYHLNLLREYLEENIGLKSELKTSQRDDGTLYNNLIAHTDKYYISVSLCYDDLSFKALNGWDPIDNRILCVTLYDIRYVGYDEYDDDAFVGEPHIYWKDMDHICDIIQPGYLREKNIEQILN